MTRRACPLLQSAQHTISWLPISLLQLDPTSITDGVAVTGLYELSRQWCCWCTAFESLWGSWTCMTQLPQSRERQQQYYFHTIYQYLQDWGLDNDLVVIIVACTALGTMHMIECCTRCVNQGRLMCHKLHSACISTTSGPIFTKQVALKSSNQGLSAHMWDVQEWQKMTEISGHQ